MPPAGHVSSFLHFHARPDVRVRQAFWQRDSYVLLFGLLLVDYIILSFVNSVRWGGLCRVVPVAITLLFAVYTSDAGPRLVRFAQACILLALLGSVVQAVTGATWAAGATFALLTVLLIITPLQIVHRVFAHERVGLQTVFAALDVYVLIGLAFSAVFLATDKLAYAIRHEPHPFLAQPGFHPPSDFVYLSFVTLTTVGFGDLTPHTELARSMVVLEALMGQIFLVTMVARIVALVGVDAPVRRRVDEPVPAAPVAGPHHGPAPPPWLVPGGPPEPDSAPSLAGASPAAEVPGTERLSPGTGHPSPAPQPRPPDDVR